MTKKEKNESDIRLYELEKWTLIETNDGEQILKFLWIDWMYARWDTWIDTKDRVIIMGHANQFVWEYWEIVER